MTIRPRSHAPIKNHTEKSCDGVHTGLGERAVKSRPAHSTGVWTSQCFFTGFYLFIYFFYAAWSLFLKFQSSKESVFHLFSIKVCKIICGVMIKCLLTELGRAGQENICVSVILYGHDLEPNISLSGPPTHSVHIILLCYLYLLITWCFHLITILSFGTDGRTDCAICQEQLHLNEEVKGLPCKHLYHKECIVPWLQMVSNQSITLKVYPAEQGF
jgi:hypothetical protein